MTSDRSDGFPRPDGPEAFISRVGRALDAVPVRPITFILGSGVSNAAIPGVRRSTATGVDLLRKRAPETTEQIDAAYAEETSDAGVYQRVLRLMDSYLGPQDVKAFVQELTLEAYTPRSARAHAVLAARGSFEALREKDCHILERDLGGWSVPLGLRALGTVAAQHPDRFDRPFITTNFDPLLEIAVRRAGRSAESLAFDRDGTLRPLVGAVEQLRVAHLHGYWDGGAHTLHTARRLTERRPKLEGSLRDVMLGSLVIVMGYGGWNDVFSGTLRALVVEQSDIEVIWTLFDDERRLDGWPPGTLLHELDNAGPAVHIYHGVDAHVVLPLIAAQHNIDPIERLVSTPAARASLPDTRTRMRLDRAIHEGRLTLVRPTSSATYPEVVVWLHRLREPNIVHAGQAAVARALMQGGSRVLAVINDLGASRDMATLERLEHGLRNWVTGGANPDRLVCLRMRDQHVLFPPSVSYARIREMLELATDTRTADIAGLLANADAASSDLKDGIWHRLLNPVVFWTFLLTLQERGVPLRRIWTLSSDHHEQMWREFDEEVAPGASHLFVPALRDGSNAVLMDGPEVRADDPPSFARSLATSHQLATWTWQQLIDLPATLAGEPVAPLLVKSGEIRDSTALIAALRGAGGDEVAIELARRVWARLYGPRCAGESEPGVVA